MTQQTASVIRAHRKKTARWLCTERKGSWSRIEPIVNRAAAGLLPVLLLGLADFMGIPSALHAAWLAAAAMAGDSLLLPLLGCALTTGLRLLWGLDPRWMVVLSCAAMALAPKLLFGRKIRWTMLYTACVLLPHVITTFAAASPAEGMLACATAGMAVFAAPVFLHAMRTMKGAHPILRTEERVAVGFSAMMLLCGGSCVRLLGVQVGGAMATVATLLMAITLGVPAGTVTGMLAGAAMAARGYPLSLAVCLALGGFAAGLVRGQKKRWLCALTLLLTSGAAILTSGELDVGLLWGVAAGCAVIAFAPGQSMNRWTQQVERLSRSKTATGGAWTGISLARWQTAMRDMAREVPMPMKDDVPADAAAWRAKLCTGCPSEDSCQCMLAERSAESAAEVWQTRGEDDCSFQRAMEGLRGLGCQRLYYLREKMNELRAEQTRRDAEMRRACFRRSMIETHLTAAADAVERFGGQDGSWYEQELSDKIRAALGDASFPAELAYVHQMRGPVCLGFKAAATARQNGCEIELARLMREILPFAVDAPIREGDMITMEEASPWRVTTGQAGQALSGGDEENGDATSFFALPGGIRVCALSDGMGHGARAHEVSTQTLRLVELCLKAGYTTEQTITAVNGMMLCATQGETYATVDLLLLDLWQGKAKLIKMGAPVSCVIAEGKTESVRGAALPVGIIEEAASPVRELTLSDGMTIIMMSDGVAEAYEEPDLLRLCTDCNALGTAQGAAAALVHDLDGQEADDRSACVVRVRYEHAAMKAALLKTCLTSVRG